MAFVAEEISQEDKKKLDIEKMKKRAGIYHASVPSRWSIDRDRNVFMMFIGGGSPEIPEFYVISIDNELVVFNASFDIDGKKETGLRVNWKVIILSVPTTFETHSEEVIKLISESLDAYGIYGNRKYVAEVKSEIEFMRR